jgi:hypothetical protein
LTCTPPIEVDLADRSSSPPRTIIRLADNTEYHLGTSRYVVEQASVIRRSGYVDRPTSFAGSHR